MKDNEAKRIFRLAPVMRDLLRTCVPLDWARTVTADQLRLAGGETDGERRQKSARTTRRLSDVVWEVRHIPGQPGNAILVVLLELQDRNDPAMPLRMLEYVALHLRQRHRSGGSTPPILPIVLHTGYSPWNAPLTLDLDWPPGLVPPDLTPRLTYHHVSVGTWPLPTDDHQRNLITEIFRWLRFDGTSDVTRLIDDLIMVAERQGEHWVLNALADPLGRVFARRHNRSLPTDQVLTMQSLEEEMKTWLFSPGEGEWKQMLNEERRLRKRMERIQKQALDQKQQALDQKQQALDKEQQLREQEQQLREQEQRRFRNEQEAVLRRAILRLDPTATPATLAALDLTALRDWFDRL